MNPTAWDDRMTTVNEWLADGLLRYSADRRGQYTTKGGTTFDVPVCLDEQVFARLALAIRAGG